MEIEEEYKTYFTEFGEVNSTQTIAILNDQSVWHTVTSKDIFKASPLQLPETSVFIFKNRYLSEVFQGIMLDSKAAGVLTAGQPQFQAL